MPQQVVSSLREGRDWGSWYDRIHTHHPCHGMLMQVVDQHSGRLSYIYAGGVAQFEALLHLRSWSPGLAVMSLSWVIEAFSIVLLPDCKG